MTNTPIYRIPRDPEVSLQEIINAEAPHLNIENSMTALHDHCDDENSLSITLDWAAQLRDETGCDWGTAIDTAMTMYFG